MNALYHKDATLNDVADWSEARHVLASIGTCLRADRVSYLDASAVRVSDTLVLSTNGDAEETLLWPTLSKSTVGAHERQNGMLYVLPIYDGDVIDANAEPKGYVIAEKIRFPHERAGHVMPDGTWVDDITYQEPSIRMATMVAREFGVFLSPRYYGQALDARWRSDAWYTEFLTHMAHAMHDYIGWDSELSQHMRREAAILDLLLEYADRDTSLTFEHLSISDEMRRLIHAGHLAHDIGKGYSPASEITPYSMFEQNSGAELRNHIHPMMSYIIYALPGMQEIAMMIADHHAKRDAFEAVPDRQRMLVSHFGRVADVLESMTGRKHYIEARSQQNSLEEALADLTRLSQLDPPIVHPQVVRLLASILGDEQRCEEFLARLNAIEPARYIRRSPNAAEVTDMYGNPNSTDAILKAIHEKTGITAEDNLQQICDKILGLIPDEPFDKGGRQAEFAVVDLAVQTANQKMAEQRL